MKRVALALLGLFAVMTAHFATLAQAEETKYTLTMTGVT
jgi:hypothetical protein